jgi:hypothetical protein
LTSVTSPQPIIPQRTVCIGALYQRGPEMRLGGAARITGWIRPIQGRARFGSG